MDINKNQELTLNKGLLIFDNGIGKLLTTLELSRIIRFSPRTIYNWIHREPDFPYKKWGKAVRFNLKEVMIWLENRS